MQTLGDFTLLAEKFNAGNSTEDNVSIIIGKTLTPDHFCLVLSRKCLIKNIICQAATTGATKYVCMDGTYKLTIVGYPLLVIGTQDILFSRDFFVLATPSLMVSVLIV